jgi:formylglycine-generating enzyme required for sulfatase activity
MKKNSEIKKSCCSPARTNSNELSVGNSNYYSSERLSGIQYENMIKVDGGYFEMGYEGDDSFKEDGEGPKRKVKVDSFFLDQTAVTNAEFLKFVDDTNYITDSEKFGWAYVFIGQLKKSTVRKLNKSSTVQGLEWWIGIDGANWKKPEGPGSNIKNRMNHPVVSVSWFDAIAYAKWANKRLPTEAEWEYATRWNNNNSMNFPWGEELVPNGKHRCNVWQGNFPHENNAEDGYLWTAPAKSFKRYDNKFYNLIGNVWEWCDDWFSNDWHIEDSELTRSNPMGPQNGHRKVIKGGSFLCHESYCNRYRIGARTSNTPDSSTTNLGFRCAKSI